MSTVLLLSTPHYIESGDCGYCHDQKENYLGIPTLPQEANPPKSCTHITIGTFAHQMGTYDYSKFVNRGFRRLGRFLYKGDMLRGCCRMYTIRTNIDYLKFTKSHRKILNRFNRELNGITTDTSKGHVGLKLRDLIEIEANCGGKFYTRFELSGFTREKFELYKKYQVKVHNDDPDEVSEGQFKSFLCDTPFLDEEIEGTPEQWRVLNNWIHLQPSERKKHGRVGPTHECYYLDGKLIAISVLDFLPCGLSSVYFIWDPDYAHLSLGTLLGLREILMCNELGLGDYYLGYYIEDCIKMKYKGNFGGEILDVCNEAFIPLASVKDFMADGRFFTAAPKDSISAIKEPELKLERDPIRWDFPVVNVTQQMYGNSEIYKDAVTHSNTLIDRYKLPTPLLPNVLPGAVPMATLLNWVEAGEVGPHSPVTVLTKFGRVKEIKLKNLDARFQCSYLDMLRLFGLDVLRDAIIVHQ
ncbi:CIC11C00000001370 [Sungouiella intermedia]|uniref:arginyltransferase n=1 Tax=Sungouiella intermedia TaxID=45354 RepID=A0A1L0B604_9ASCO|nr:CIC11C00000001370 [[Candida] intermedia]